MSKATPITFESLFYYKEGDDYIVNNQDIKEMYEKAGGFEKFQIPCLSAGKNSRKFRGANSETLSIIFSEIFKQKISKEQIEQHTGQPRAAKTSSVPVKLPNIQQDKAISPIAGQTHFSNQDLIAESKESSKSDSKESLTAKPQLKKETSAPVSKTTKEINTQPKNNFTIESLIYYKDKYKEKDLYYVKSERFINLFDEKTLYDKIGVRKQGIKKGVCILHTNDVNKISEIFTQIFENTITPDQVIKNEKKNPASLPPKPNQPPNPNQPSKPEPAPSQAPVQKQTIANNINPNAIKLDKEKFAKLICLLGAPPWMINNEIHLKFEPSNKV